MSCQRKLSAVTPSIKINQNIQMLFLQTNLWPSILQIHIVCSFPRFEHPPSLLAKSELRYNGLSRICIHKWKDIPAFILFGKVSILGKVKYLKKQKAAYHVFKNDFFLFLETWYRDWIWKQRDRRKESTKYLPKNH